MLRDVSEEQLLKVEMRGQAKFGHMGVACSHVFGP